MTTDFSDGGRNYRLKLLERDPVYLPAPHDPDIAFRRTLDAKFAANYAFHYVGRPGGGRDFSVQSYSVYSRPASEQSPLVYGVDLYVVFAPTRPIAVPRWIQVGRWSDATGKTWSAVDNADRANPFYLTGGLTSIYGRRIVNVDYANQMAAFPDQTTLTSSFRAEIFLAEVTAAKDAAGRRVVRIHGGIRYGWQVQERTA